MKNLLDVLETRSLAFNQTSVFYLIAQSLWQIGPLNVINNFFPESHYDFTDPVYLNVICEIIDNNLKLITKKWNDYLAIYVIITIVQRIMTIMRDCYRDRLKLIKLLRRCRQISKSWELMLIEAIENQNNDCQLNDVVDLSMILTYACCFSLLTFNVDNRFLGDLMSNDIDLVDWLTSYATFEKQKNKSNQNSTISFLPKLFDQVEICTVRVSVQYMSLVTANNGLALTTFVGKIWPDEKLGVFDNWKLVYDHDFPCWLTTIFTNRETHSLSLLDVNIKGKLLINNFPNGTLPIGILSHSDYFQFFETTNFEVRSSSRGAGSFVSLIKHSSTENVSLTFFLVNSDLVVLERIENMTDASCIESQLIPRRLFKDLFPESFSQNFSHWLNKSTNCVEFRLPKFSEYVQNKIPTFQYYFRLNDLTLRDMCKVDRCLIDIKSATFDEITAKITNRLDKTKYVHIFTNINDSNEYYIHLTRLNLKFTAFVDRECVMSDDFIGSYNIN